MTSNREKLRRAKSVVRELLSWFLCFGFAVIAALFLRTYVYEFVYVDGPSMEPTLYTGEFVFVEKLSARSGKIEYGDILIVKYPNDDKNYIKRVVGKPGDEIEVRDGTLYVDGIARDEDFTKDSRINYELPLTEIPYGSYFVLGDNRNNSMDSHTARIGAIPEERIVGHAVFVVWPFDHMKTLDA